MGNLSMSPCSIRKNDFLNFSYSLAFFRLLVNIHINTLPLSSIRKNSAVFTGEKKIVYRIGIYTNDIESYIKKE